MSSQQDPTQNLLQTLEKTAKLYLNVFTTLNPTLLTPILSSTFAHTFAPASLGLPEALDAAAFSSHLRDLATLMRSFTVTPLQIWPNPTLRQVNIHAESQADFWEDVMDGDAAEWEYRGEYIFVLSMDGTGEKIESVLEFLDSSGTERLRKLMARARANRKRDG